jgi:chemotaxis protein methyltransferase CheR
MKPFLADAVLEKLSADIARHLGLHFPPSQWSTLENGMRTAATELEFENIHEYVARFTSAPPTRELIESMAGFLTIGETYFFREARCFEILEQRIIPDIIRKGQGGKQRLRIWSCGCATGEEPYSIAILLHTLRNELHDVDSSILATDINPHALRKAREGIYTKWSFRTTPRGYLRNYFLETGDGRFELLPVIREMVSFASLNLVEECYSSQVTDNDMFDVIFCRNVLMYLTPELATQAVARFHQLLPVGGWLFVSPCECSSSLFSGYEPIAFPDAIFYRKSESRNRVQQDPGNVSSLFQGEVIKENPTSHEAPLAMEQGACRESSENITLPLPQELHDLEALGLLCRACADEGRLAEALQLSDRALAADKLSAGLHYLRAIILQEQGMNDDATVSLKKALYLDQDLVLAHFTLATLEQRKGKIKESRRYFHNALSLLDRYDTDDIIPESDGMSAVRLREIIMVTTAAMGQGV